LRYDENPPSSITPPLFWSSSKLCGLRHVVY
jgi:hypothetical protein